MFRAAFALLFACVIPFISPAKADETYRDWKLAELAEDPLLKVPVCHAFTSVSNQEIPIELSLTFPKNLSKAPVAFIKLDPALNATRIVIKTSSRVSEPALALNVDGDELRSSYWYIPMDMDRLIDKIIAANYLDIIIFTQGSETPLKVSLRGSSRILQLTKRCVGGKLFSESFFEALNKEDAPSYPVEGEITIDRGFEFFQTAYIYHVGAAEAQKQLDALRYDNRRLIREEQAAQGEYDTAQGRLDRAQADLNANDDERFTNQQLIQAKQKLLVQLEQNKLTAEATLAKKKAAYDPLREQARQYLARIEDAENAVASAERRIRSLRSQISEAQNEIDQLRNEAGNLEDQIRSWERQISSLESDLSSAERDYRNYDVSRETDRILNSDFRYRNAQSELRQRESELQNARQRVREAQGNLDSAERKLQLCLNDPNRDCSGEKSEVDYARAQLNQAQSDESRIDQQIRNLQWEIQRIESSARDEAQRQKQELSRRVNEISSEIQSYQNRVRDGRSRIRSIFEYEIPSREQTIRSAQSEIPRQERALSSARRDLSAAQQEYADFRKRTDYDRIKEEYRQAEKALEAIVREIRESNEAIASAQRKITRLDRERPALVQTLERRKTTADLKLQKLQEVQSRMGEFKSKEGDLVKNLEAMLQQFDQARGLYKTVISEILN